jgi:tRNA(fMet)-specific endonuclease VapC
VRYLLDTNIVIAALLAEGEEVRARLAELDADEPVTSSIVIAEVLHGSERDKPPPIEAVERFMEEVVVLPFDSAAAREYAKLAFERRSFDRLIAAHALACDLIVVTGNEKDFADVPGLRVENWTV